RVISAPESTKALVIATRPATDAPTPSAPKALVTAPTAEPSRAIEDSVFPTICSTFVRPDCRLASFALTSIVSAANAMSPPQLHELPDEQLGVFHPEKLADGRQRTPFEGAAHHVPCLNRHALLDAQERLVARLPVTLPREE